MNWGVAILFAMLLRVDNLSLQQSQCHKGVRPDSAQLPPTRTRTGVAQTAAIVYTSPETNRFID